MTKKGVIGLMLAGALLLVPITSCSSDLGKTPEFSGDRQIHIGAWVAPPPEFITDENYKAIADSGISTIYGLYDTNPQDIQNALKCAENNGIKYYVRDVSLGVVHEEDFDLLSDLVSRYKDSPAFAGNLVADEPSPDKFEQLGILHTAYEKLLPDKDFYINLFPTYSSLAQRGGLSYKEYIQKYIDTVKPEFFSYDHYPLRQMVDGTAINEDYLLNLGIVSDTVKKAGIPLWTFIQSIEFTSAGMTNRLPGESDIRWQVYTNLAFGAQGIQYFCYWTPGNDGVAMFKGAMIDTDGTKTPMYTSVQHVNQEIRNFENAYLSMQNVGVMTFPAENKPPELYTENPLLTWAPIETVKSDKPVIIGCFENNNGNKGMILVNYTDPGKKESNTVTIHFKGIKGLTVYKKGTAQLAALQGGNYKVTLEPGEGQFILINQ